MPWIKIIFLCCFPKSLFPQCIFDHWQIMPGDPMEGGSKPYEIVKDIKKRKGLKPGPPNVDNYLFKM
jgi:elongation factor 2